jgi:hypothetical protein
MRTTTRPLLRALLPIVVAAAALLDGAPSHAADEIAGERDHPSQALAPDRADDPSQIASP